jgi:hypothetical protein
MKASRNQLIVLGVLVLIALFTLPRLFFGGSTTSPTATSASGAVPAARPGTNNARTGRQAQQHPKLLPPSLDPALRHDLLALGESYQYDGSKRNIFEARQIEIPKPIDPGIAQGPKVPAPPIVQSLPPIPLKFYGFAQQQGQAKRVFLSSGDDVFVGTEGQVINKRYRIVKINPNSVIIEDILNNNTQPIPLTSQT